MSRSDRHFTLNLFQRRSLDHTAMSLIWKYAPPGSQCHRAVAIPRGPSQCRPSGTGPRDSCARESPCGWRGARSAPLLDRSGGSLSRNKCLSCKRL